MEQLESGLKFTFVMHLRISIEIQESSPLMLVNLTPVVHETCQFLDMSQLSTFGLGHCCLLLF
jgi:hypothetical protein